MFNTFPVKQLTKFLFDFGEIDIHQKQQQKSSQIIVKNKYLNSILVDDSSGIVVNKK